MNQPPESGGDGKTPQPVAPKDSLSVEVEGLNDFLDKINALVKDNKVWEEMYSVHTKDYQNTISRLKQQLATAQAQLRRKDDALKKIVVKNILGNVLSEILEMQDIARAALADGKEGGR